MQRSLVLVSVVLWIGLFLSLGESLRALQTQTAPAPPPASAPPPVRQPKAKSQEEFAAYQKFMREPKPDEQIRLIEDFLLQYPDSELKEFAFQTATQAYQAKDDYARVLTYGELTLTEIGRASCRERVYVLV